jgi:hypothetical protein
MDRGLKNIFNLSVIYHLRTNNKKSFNFLAKKFRRDDHCCYDEDEVSYFHSFFSCDCF